MLKLSPSSFLTCIDCRGVIGGIIWAVTLAAELSYHLVNTFIVPRVVSTSWIVRVCSTNKQLIGVHFGENSDVIVAVVCRLPLDKAQLHVAIPRVPVDPVVQVLLQVAQTEIVNDISGSDQERVPILPEKLEVVRVSVVSRKCVNLVCKIEKILSEVPPGK